MTLDFHNFEEDRSLEPPAWFQTRMFQILNLLNTMVKTVFGPEADAKLFGSSISGMTNFRSDVDVHFQHPENLQNGTFGPAWASGATNQKRQRYEESTCEKREHAHRTCYVSRESYILLDVSQE